MTQFFGDVFIGDALVRGATIAVVGIGLYVLQKNSKTREDKRDMARILRHEVRRALSIVPSRERERIISDRRDRIPSGKVYSGLLQTGNIRFFSDEVQDNLDEWYLYIDNFKFDSIDHDAGLEVMRNLEEMERKNRSYKSMMRTVIFESRYSSRHKK